jgi:hypothetical protein
MPGVRYGPDISDDAAFILDSVKELQAKLRKGLTLSKDRKGKAGEATKLAQYKKLAKDIFGVSEKDFDRGRFGDLATMATYGGSKSRSKLAKSWRTGGQMKKSVTQEFVDRGVPGGRRAGSTKTPDTAWYVGRTRPKKFREIEGRIQRRLNRNGTSYGGVSVPPRGAKPDNFLAAVDSLNITRARGKTNTPAASDLTNRPRGVSRGARPGSSIRPPLPKSAIAAEKRRRAQSGTKKARELAGKGKGKSGGKPKAPKKPKKA